MTSHAAEATLTLQDKSLTLQGVPATDGADALSVSNLLKETGTVTYDAGFVNTASCKSAITYIDGDAGILRYRGYPIEQLAEKSSFVEVSYLLIYGELPTQTQLAEFEDRIRRHTMLHEDLKAFFNGFPRDAHPMPVLSSAVSALSTFYQDSLDPFNKEQVELSTVRLHGQAADHRGVCAQEVGGAAVPLPRQLAVAHRELPADDVRVPRRALRARPHAGQGARPALHPPRRPRAELLDLDGADGRQRPGQPLRVGVGRASTPSSGRCTAAPTRPCSRCSARCSGPTTTSTRS